MKPAHVTYSGLPKTLDEAVEHLDRLLNPSYKRVIAETLKDDIPDYHFGLGLMIRSAFKLREGNPALLASCDASDPDDASVAIMDALWTRLQEDPVNL